MISQSYGQEQVNLVIARIDITQFGYNTILFWTPFFLFYNMKSSDVEKNLSYRLVNMVEISVNTVVVIIKMGLSRHKA